MKYPAVVKQSTKPIAFILGKYLTSGLGVVRSFAAKDVPTIVVTSEKSQVSWYSRFTHGIRCPDPQNNSNEYIALLVDIGKQLRTKGVLFPISDTDLYVILQNHKQLEPYYLFPSSDFSVVNQLLNKQLFYHLLEQHDVPHPKTYYPKTERDIQKICQEISYPCILKPVYSSFFVSKFHTKLFQVRSADELHHLFFNAKQQQYELMVQEVIPGDATNMFGLNAYFPQHGESQGVTMYQRIREWPHGFGNGCYIKNVRVPELESLIFPLLKKIGFHGIVDIEFRWDARDSSFKVIEINPRIWMQNTLPVRLGANHAFFAYCDVCNEKKPNLLLSKNDVFWLYFFDDAQSALASIRHGRLTFYDWIVSLKGNKEYAVFSKDDPLPFFVLSIFSLFSWLAKPINYLLCLRTKK